MNAQFFVRSTVIALVCFLLAAQLSAAVKPHALFSDGAVLQRGQKVPVWGTAGNGEKVTVSISGQEVSTTAADGKWRLDLAPLETGGPWEMIISGENTIKLSNILVGEVWIASGQSNMQWEVKLCDDSEKVIKESANSQIRLFSVKRQAALEVQDDVDAAWQECSPQTVGDFSGVAYFFGRDLQQNLKVPIGLINTSYGGSPGEAWVPRRALTAEPDLKKLASLPTRNDNHSPCGLYNAMLHPLIPYAIRGAIWYQGESNTGRSYEYRTLLTTLIKDWRAEWGQGDFPFLLVQLAPSMRIDYEPKDSGWAELREAQLRATQLLPSVGMAVITDVGQENDSHSKLKAPVGARLALAARALAYGEKIPYSGPEFSQQEIAGDRIVLSFKHTDGGLVSLGGGALYGFTIAGEDRKFVNAYAEIQGDKVVVSSVEVKNPVAVRFGWADYPLVNLWNGAGLPASPFRTDDFPLSTQPK